MYKDFDKKDRQELLHMIIEIHIALMNRYNKVANQYMNKYQSLNDLIKDIRAYASNNSAWGIFGVNNNQLIQLRMLRNKLAHPNVEVDFEVNEMRRTMVKNLYKKCCIM